MVAQVEVYILGAANFHSMANGPQSLRSILQVDEIENDLRLRCLLGHLILYFHVTFANWSHPVRTSLSSAGEASLSTVPSFLWERPPVWLLSPEGSKMLLQACDMLSVLGLIWVFFECTGPLLLLAILFCVKLAYYASDFMLLANYDHMHLYLVFVFLIARRRMFFMRAALGVLYILSGLVKLTPSWLQGEYFLSLPGQFPLLPQGYVSVVIASQLVILLEFAGPLCWYSRWKWLRAFSFANFLLFHLYSGAVVGFRYPALMLPTICLLFLGGLSEPFDKGWSCRLRDLPGWLALCLGLVGGCIPWMIPGDARLTGEGRYFGCFMYDAERRVTFEYTLYKGPRRIEIRGERLWQLPHNWGVFAWRSACQVKVYEHDHLTIDRLVSSSRRNVGSRVLKLDGVVVFNPGPFDFANARQIGDPYMYYAYARRILTNYHPDRLSLRVYQQLDGQELRHKVLDIDDFEKLNPVYHPLSRNDWILDDTL